MKTRIKQYNRLQHQLEEENLCFKKILTFIQQTYVTLSYKNWYSLSHLLQVCFIVEDKTFYSMADDKKYIFLFMAHNFKE